MDLDISKYTPQELHTMMVEARERGEISDQVWGYFFNGSLQQNPYKPQPLLRQPPAEGGGE